MRTKRINQVFLMIVCLYLIGAVVIAFFFPTFVSTPSGSVLTAQGLILAGTLIGCRMLCVRPVSHMRLRPVGIGALLSGVVCTIAIYPFLVLVSSLMQLWFKSGTDAVTDVLSEGNPLLNLLIYALLPACAEEMMNRGLLYRAYRQALGVRRAILLSGFLFGVFHMNLDQFAYTFLFGIFLCLIMEATDSLIACMVCHAALNAVSVAASFLIGRTASAALRSAVTISASVCMTLTILLLAAAAVLVCFFRLLLHCSGRREAFRTALASSAETDDRIVTAELAAAVGICVLYMIAYEAVI